MSEREKGPGLRSLLGRIIGLKFDPGQITRLDKGLGTETVDPAFERLLGEATGGRRNGPVQLQPNWTPGERAVFTTRFIAEEFDSGGPLAMLANRPLLDEAITGFRLLGLVEHADALVQLIASGLNEDSEDEEIEDWAEDWLNIEDGDPARAEYIRSHPEEFRP